jgi:hypothetical protein
MAKANTRKKAQSPMKAKKRHHVKNTQADGQERAQAIAEDGHEES